MTTEIFYDKLTELLPFLKQLDESVRHQLLKDAWNSSISVDSTFQGRLQHLSEQATADNPVFLVSNTNELNAIAALEALKLAHPDLPFIDPIDISNTRSEKPVEILPNVFLCVSYRFGMFKTDQMLSDLKTRFVPENEPFNLVSQWEGDRKKASELGGNVCDVETYFTKGYAYN